MAHLCTGALVTGYYVALQSWWRWLKRPDPLNEWWVWVKAASWAAPEKATWKAVSRGHAAQLYRSRRTCRLAPTGKTMQVPEAQPQVPETVELNMSMRHECGHFCSWSSVATEQGTFRWQSYTGALSVPLNINLAPKPSISYNPQSHPVNKLLFLLSALCIALTHRHERPTRVRQ